MGKFQGAPTSVSRRLNSLLRKSSSVTASVPLYDAESALMALLILADFADRSPWRPRVQVHARIDKTMGCFGAASIKGDQSSTSARAVLPSGEELAIVRSALRIISAVSSELRDG